MSKVDVKALVAKKIQSFFLDDMSREEIRSLSEWAEEAITEALQAQAEEYEAAGAVSKQEILDLIAAGTKEIEQLQQQLEAENSRLSSIKNCVASIQSDVLILTELIGQ